METSEFNELNGNFEILDYTLEAMCQHKYLTKVCTYFLFRSWLSSSFPFLSKEHVKKLESTCSYEEMYLFWLLLQNCDQLSLKKYIENRLKDAEDTIVKIDISSPEIDCTCNFADLVKNKALIYHRVDPNGESEGQGIELTDSQNLHYLGCLQKPDKNLEDSRWRTKNSSGLLGFLKSYKKDHGNKDHKDHIA